MRIIASYILVAVLLSLSVVWSGCGLGSQFSAGKGQKYVYAYRMIGPVENNDMLFQDDSLVVQFRVDEAAVKFQIQNLAATGAMIDYNHASLGVDGQMHPVRFSRTMYRDSLGTNQSVVIPPMAYIRDLVIPYDNIFFNGRRWMEVDLLPTSDNNSETMRSSILSRAGKSVVTLVLPMQFGAVAKTYTFDFQVSSTTRIPWRDYQPAKRVPGPPEPKTSSLDQVTTAIVAVGVLGFTAFLITAAKEPPTE